MTTGQPPATQPETGPAEEEQLPTVAEQMADQLGGWRGLFESSIPVVVFVITNIVGELRPAVIASVTVALLIGGLRLAQRRPVRHAVNGLLGIAIGAAIAWRTGEARDFYLPGIIYGIGYGVALLISAAVRQPLVGWLWSVLVAKGSAEWRDDPKLVRTFTGLTVLWGVVWLAKVGVQAGLYLAEQDTALGVARLVLGYPPYVLLLLITVWTVRRVTRQSHPNAQPTPLPGG